MIEAGKTYKSAINSGSVTVNAVCGDNVYYTDEYGCWFRGTTQTFARNYIVL